MNSLSIVLYIAGVSEGIGVVLFLVATCAGLGVMILHLMHRIDEDVVASPPSRWIIFASIFALFVVALIPSEETILMIAASEYSEEAIETEFGKEVITEARRAILDALRGAKEAAE